MNDRGQRTQIKSLTEQKNANLQQVEDLQAKLESRIQEAGKLQSELDSCKAQINLLIERSSDINIQKALTETDSKVQQLMMKEKLLTQKNSQLRSLYENSQKLVINLQEQKQQLAYKLVTSTKAKISAFNIQLRDIIEDQWDSFSSATPKDSDFAETLSLFQDMQSQYIDAYAVPKKTIAYLEKALSDARKLQKDVEDQFKRKNSQMRQEYDQNTNTLVEKLQRSEEHTAHSRLEVKELNKQLEAASEDQATLLIGGMLKQEEQKIRDEQTGEKQVEQIQLAQSFAEKVLQAVTKEKRAAL